MSASIIYLNNNYYKNYTNLLAVKFGSLSSPMYDILEDGGKWSHANTSSYKHRYLVLIPVLVSFSKWSINIKLGIRLVTKNI